jgi:hypothetical protein
MPEGGMEERSIQGMSVKVDSLGRVSLGQYRKVVGVLFNECPEMFGPAGSLVPVKCPVTDVEPNASPDPDLGLLLGRKPVQINFLHNFNLLDGTKINDH